jgi:hypothetical protein
MRVLLPLAAAVVLAITGCGDSTTSKKTSSGNTNAAADSASPLTAPVDYLDAINKGQRSAERTVDTASLTKAIELFHIENGRFPKDLNELVTEKFLPQIPTPPRGMKISYDAATGKVKVVPQ